MGDRDHLRLAFEQRRVGVHVEQAVVGDADPVDLGARALGEELPRDDVGVVLHLGEHDPVAGADVGGAPGVGDEVDRLGRVANEDDLATIGRAEMVGDGCPSALVRGGCLG